LRQKHASFPLFSLNTSPFLTNKKTFSLQQKNAFFATFSTFRPFREFDFNQQCGNFVGFRFEDAQLLTSRPAYFVGVFLYSRGVTAAEAR
jgi:hypothetical protein